MTNGNKSIVENALKAMLYEVTVTPKPGLVDPASNGSHEDMTAFTFIDSTLALRPYFESLAAVGSQFAESDLRQLFAEIRSLGLSAEKTMFAATGGVNTHKGAIFSLGLLVTAASYQEKRENLTTLAVIDTVKQMLSGLTKKDLQLEQAPIKSHKTAGELQFQRYGLTGIRGEAEAGFPSVVNLALPYLRQSTGSLNARFLDTLMLIAGQLDDSTLIKRAGSTEILIEMREASAHYFASVDKQKFLRNLDQDFTKRHLSLGGSADMLILTIFFWLLEQ